MDPPLWPTWPDSLLPCLLSFGCRLETDHRSADLLPREPGLARDFVARLEVFLRALLVFREHRPDMIGISTCHRCSDTLANARKLRRAVLTFRYLGVEGVEELLRQLSELFKRRFPRPSNKLGAQRVKQCVHMLLPFGLWSRVTKSLNTVSHLLEMSTFNI